MKDGFDLAAELKKIPECPGVYLMHDKNDEIIYDSIPEKIIVPRRAYTVNYNANGGTVTRTEDIVAYKFEGYFYNGIKIRKA